MLSGELICFNKSLENLNVLISDISYLHINNNFKF